MKCSVRDSGLAGGEGLTKGFWSWRSMPRDADIASGLDAEKEDYESIIVKKA